MGFSCKNCGGNVLFDIKSQKLKCQHCGSCFEPESFPVQSSCEEGPEPGSELRVFRCGNCGARLHGTEESMVGSCPYCGGQSLLLSEQSDEEKPEQILPFQITKESCADLFRQHTANVRYLSKELRDPAGLKSFTGIYIPFYSYDEELLPSQLEYSVTSCDWKEHFKADISAEKSYRSPPFDASRCLDDTITSRILPYHTKELKPYHPAYLSGFYADSATVSHETYAYDALVLAQDHLAKAAIKEGQVDNRPLNRLKLHPQGFHRLLCPMWFLTWQRGKRVAYAVVNGETGKFSVDLPVDLRSFALGCLYTALALFALLELLVQPTPGFAASLSLLAVIIMSRSIRNITQAIYEKQVHLRDKGWTGDAGILSKKSGGRAFLRFLLLAFIFFRLVRKGLFSGSGFIFAMETIFYYALPRFAAVFLLIDFIDVIYYQIRIPGKLPLLAMLMLAVSAAGYLALRLAFPAADIWYYLCCIASILLTTLSSLVMLQIYNISVTRPLPTFFDREEVT